METRIWKKALSWHRFLFCSIISLSMTLLTSTHLQAQQDRGFKPIALACDSLITPLGIDDSQPVLSWKLDDKRVGARQSSYEILVASKASLLQPGKADIWDSGKTASDQSVDVPYKGPALTPSKRYYWAVQLWDHEGKPYPLSDASWWETGLFDSKNWSAKWIGYEDLEQSSVRAARAQWVMASPSAANHADAPDIKDAFRLNFELTKPVKKASLYVTGQDTAAAWINGKQVLEAQALPPWGRTPWRTYTRKDISSSLKAGKNLLAIEITLYGKHPDVQAPMSATLYFEFQDGSTKVLKTGDPEWKSFVQAPNGWVEENFDDSSWQAAVPYAPRHDTFGNPDRLGSPLPTAAVAALRKTFSITKPIASARLYATALGLYKFHLNGHLVGDQALSPGWTDYRQRVAYQAYDVTALMEKGGNALGAYLAPGWYSTSLEWIGQGNNYGETPDALRAQLRIEHTDGSVDWIVTDESWKADHSPISFAEIYDGETFDSRLKQTGWDTATFSDTKWHPAQLIQPKEPEIVWQSFQPIRETGTLPAKTVHSPKSGVFVYDFGQEIAGVARVRVKGTAGTRLTLRFAEVLNPDGTIYIENLRNAKATDHYVLSGTGSEEYQPSFTFHGFRYLEITGLDQAPPLQEVKAVVWNTDAPITVKLETGSQMVNQLWSNILWGQRSNFLSVPTDCPQRDERLGWSADAQVFWRAASYNMELSAFSRKYSADLRGTQLTTPMYGIYAPGTLQMNPGYGTGWSDAGVIIPWTSWIQTGDRRILEENWAGMEKYLTAIAKANPDFLWKRDSGIAFGDWLSPEGTTPQELISTAYWAYDVSLMRQMAHALGKSAEEEKYGALFSKIKEAFIRSYVHPNGLVGAVATPRGEGAPVETQTGYVLALNMNLLPEELRQTAAQRLVDRIAGNGWKLGTGFLGTPYLMEVLTDTKHADVAYRLLLNTGYPSWGYMVEHGATTMWERWNGDQMRHDPGMNSYNHYAYGAVAEWIYRYAAGIDTLPDDPGFRTILLRPHFDERLGKVVFSYNSQYGEIKSSWTAAKGKVTWTVTIPPNTKAHLPLSKEQTVRTTVDGKAIGQSPLVHLLAQGERESTYELMAGSYTFQIAPEQQ